MISIYQDDIFRSAISADHASKLSVIFFNLLKCYLGGLKGICEPMQSVSCLLSWLLMNQYTFNWSVIIFNGLKYQNFPSRTCLGTQTKVK